jgi:transcriptional regulator with XRE-family HTH domain
MNMKAESPSPTGPTFGDAVHAARLHYELTQIQLCELTGWTQPFLSRLETGGRTPREETLHRLSTAINEPVSTILLRVGL